MSEQRSTTLPVVGLTYEPGRMQDATFPRRVERIDVSRRSPVYDRIEFRRLLADGSRGVVQSCYGSSWSAWVRKFDAKAQGTRPIPDFPDALTGVQFYARTSDGRWHYVTHAGTWAACPPPVEGATP